MCDYFKYFLSNETHDKIPGDPFKDAHPHSAGSNIPLI